MKKRQVFGLVVAGLLAGFVSSAVAQSATAYSSTAVGVIKKTLPANKLALVSVPLDQESDDGQGFTFQSVPAISNLPNLSVANFWDPVDQRWVSQTKTKNSWGTQKNRRIVPGEAFFLYNPQSTNIELIVSGEVPTNATLSRALVNNALQVAANPYPVPMVLTNMSFASELPNLSVVNFWDETNQRWISQTKTKNSWGTYKNRVIQPGEGFFVLPYQTEAIWTESRPYTWPK